MRALGFEPKKEEIRRMITDIDKDGSGMYNLYSLCVDQQRVVLGFVFDMSFGYVSFRYN